MTTVTSAPTTFEQFVTEWSPRIRSIAYNEGFRGVDLEDATQHIIEDFWEKDYVANFDPEKGTFQVYAYGQTRFRLRHYKTARYLRSTREVTVDLVDDITVDKAIGDESLFEIALTSELNDALSATYRELLKLPATPTKNLALLFRAMVEQVAKDGDINVTDIARGLEALAPNPKSKDGSYSRQGIAAQIKDLIDTGAMKSLKALLS